MKCIEMFRKVEKEYFAMRFGEYYVTAGRTGDDIKFVAKMDEYSFFEDCILDYMKAKVYTAIGVKLVIRSLHTNITYDMMEIIKVRKITSFDIYETKGLK